MDGDQTGVVGQTSLYRSGYNIVPRAGGPRPRQLHGDHLDVDGVLLDIRRVGRGHHKRVRNEGYPAGGDQIWFAVQRGQGVLAACHQFALLALDLLKSLDSLAVAGAGLFGLPGAGGGQFGLLIVQPPADKHLAFGKGVGQGLLAVERHAAGDTLGQEGAGQFRLPSGGHGQPLCRGGQTASALEQEQMLDRAYLDFGTLILPDADQTALKRLFATSPRPRVATSPRPRVSSSPRLRVPVSPRPSLTTAPRPRVALIICNVGAADYGKKRHVKQIGLAGGGIDKHRTALAGIRQTPGHQSAEALEDRFAGMEPDQIPVVRRERHREALPALSGVDFEGGQ